MDPDAAERASVGPYGKTQEKLGRSERQSLLRD
jgi:hypothetical protein